MIYWLDWPDIQVLLQNKFPLHMNCQNMQSLTPALRPVSFSICFNVLFYNNLPNKCHCECSFHVPILTSYCPLLTEIVKLFFSKIWWHFLWNATGWYSSKLHIRHDKSLTAIVTKGGRAEQSVNCLQIYTHPLLYWVHLWKCLLTQISSQPVKWLGFEAGFKTTCFSLNQAWEWGKRIEVI